MTTPIPEGSVIITPTEIYREMLATHQTVEAMSGKLDAALSTQTDHEARIRSLERRFWVGLGVIGTLSTGASALIAQAMTHR